MRWKTKTYQNRIETESKLMKNQEKREHFMFGVERRHDQTRINMSLFNDPGEAMRWIPAFGSLKVADVLSPISEHTMMAKLATNASVKSAMLAPPAVPTAVPSEIT